MDYFLSQSKGHKSGQSITPSVTGKGESVIYKVDEKISKEDLVEKTTITDLNQVSPLPEIDKNKRYK